MSAPVTNGFCAASANFIAAVRAGKPVLCEKPLSQSSRECLDVMNAEMATGRYFIQLGFMRRFDQSYIEMKNALDEGKLGRALIMHNFHRNVETPAADFTGAMAITKEPAACPSSPSTAPVYTAPLSV